VWCKSLTVLALATLVGSPALAQRNGVGIGIIVGEPTGVNAKFWMADNHAIDASAAWSFVNEGAFHIDADYMVHKYDIFSVSKGQLPAYIGLGARIKFATETRIAARVPVGVDYLFANSPFDLFVEVVPMLDLTPSTDFRFNAAIGFRYTLQSGS
jgi:hypothetical protein